MGGLERAGIRHYVALARPDHWLKHVFVLPGTVLGLALQGLPETTASRWAIDLALALASACAVASANYVINEWLDRDFDRHHPEKSRRPAVRFRLSPLLVWGEYALLLGLGLVLASRLSPLFLVTSAAFAASGLLYNVPPVRLKERAILDVLIEAINNPLRFVLGWAVVDPTTLPPSSVLLAYWMGGAFLMTTKRFAEYRAVAARAGREALVRYRRSFRRYSEESLLVAAVVYALLASASLAVFLVKYRIEYVIALPLVVALFGVYLRLGLRPDSPVQAPEKLIRQPLLMASVGAVVLAFFVLTWTDLPWLERLAEPHYVRVPTPDP